MREPMLMQNTWKDESLFSLLALSRLNVLRAISPSEVIWRPLRATVANSPTPMIRTNAMYQMYSSTKSRIPIKSK